MFVFCKEVIMKNSSNTTLSAEQKNHELLQNQRKEYQERNRRSHRLIVKGAIIENLFPKTATMSADEFKEFILENMASDSELSDDFSW